MICAGIPSAPAPWLAEYLHELAVFPNGKHDDQADSTAQLLDWFRRPCPVSSFIETMRRVKRLRKPENPERFRGSPAGASRPRRRTNLLGRHINVGLDGTIEMLAADAEFYFRDGWTKLAEWTTEEEAAAEPSKPQPMPQPGSLEWFDMQKRKAEQSGGAA